MVKYICCLFHTDKFSLKQFITWYWVPTGANPRVGLDDLVVDHDAVQAVAVELPGRRRREDCDDEVSKLKFSLKITSINIYYYMSN